LGLAGSEGSPVQVAGLGDLQLAFGENDELDITVRR
jgi:hypothetical protein